MENVDRHVAGFVLEIQWRDLPAEVQLRAVMCSIDVLGAMLAGTVTPVAGIGRRAAARYFPGTSASILPGGTRASLPGAALANGFAANALDIDDGHPLIKGHPGAVVFPALMAAAEFRRTRFQDFLAALVSAYEVAVRAGLVMQEHYHYYHSSGAWGAVGAAAGVARLFGFDDSRVVQAVSVADFHAPLVPVMRSVRRPAMSKDGVGWGSMTGVLAAMMAGEGFTGGGSLFTWPEGRSKVMDLGGTYEIMNVYFKSYACCRWAHPAIDAVIDLRQAHQFKPADVEKIRVKTFGAAAELYREKPGDTEQAQYNAVYPIAAAMAAGEVGPTQVLMDSGLSSEIFPLMDRVEICIDERFEKLFPARRLCEVEILLKDGRIFVSGIYESGPGHQTPVSLEWIIEKFHRLTDGILPENRAGELIALLTAPEKNPPVGDIIKVMAQP
ncbi:MAG TPA: MmgE/PrpD family protein [Desulfobacteraceae bacterium]|nr:MmgE/PrpD family protein [Desulfobacteraceae bacterium]